MSSRRNSPARPARAVRSVSFVEGTQDPAPRQRIKTPGPHRSRQLAEMTFDPVDPEYVEVYKDELQLLREGLAGGRKTHVSSMSTPSPRGRKTPRSSRSRRSTPGSSGRSEAARRRRRDSRGRFLPTPEAQERSPRGHRNMEPVLINFDDAASSESEATESRSSVSTTATDASTDAETRVSMTDVQGLRRIAPRRPDSPDPRRRMTLAQKTPPRRSHPRPQQHPDLPLPRRTSSVHEDTSAEDDGDAASIDDARKRRKSAKSRKSAALEAAIQKSPEVRQIVKEMVAECLADASASQEEEEEEAAPPRARTTPRRPRGRSTPRRRRSTPRH